MTEDKRNHRVKSDFGTHDYYKHYKSSNDNPVSRADFGSILKEFNKHVADRLSLKGAGYIFPNRIGKVELRKVKKEIKIGDNGEIINNLPVNWQETKKLWAENPRAKERGIKKRFTNDHTDGHTFRVLYLRSKANYKNKSIYKAQFNRDLKRQLSASIFAGRIDAFLK